MSISASLPPLRYTVKLSKGKVKRYTRRHLRVIRNAQRKTRPRQLSAKRLARRALWA